MEIFRFFLQRKKSNLYIVLQLKEGLNFCDRIFIWGFWKDFLKFTVRWTKIVAWTRCFHEILFVAFTDTLSITGSHYVNLTVKYNHYASFIELTFTNMKANLFSINVLSIANAINSACNQKQNEKEDVTWDKKRKEYKNSARDNWERESIDYNYLELLPPLRKSSGKTSLTITHHP